MKRKINGKTMLAAASVCAVTAAVVCVNINSKETDKIVETDSLIEQETESLELTTQDTAKQEEQQIDKNEELEYLGNGTWESLGCESATHK